MELAADDISLEPSSNMRRLFIKPGGSDPGPDGDGRWRPDGPMPGDGARLGGVARPSPESVSEHDCGGGEEQNRKNVFISILELKKKWFECGIVNELKMKCSNWLRM